MSEYHFQVTFYNIVITLYNLNIYVKTAEKKAIEDEEFFTKSKVGRPKHHKKNCLEFSKKII